MSAPRIVDVVQAPAELLNGLDVQALLASPDRSAFVVVRSGVFADRWFERGEVVVCRVGARTGQAVVLVAHTRGRPCLGHQRGSGYTGDRGEPCSRDRWFAAGAITAIWGRKDLGWKVEVLDGSLDVGLGASLRPVAARMRGGEGEWDVLPSAQTPGDFSQLSLFARAA